MSGITDPTQRHAHFGLSRFVSPREAAFHLRRSPAYIYERLSRGEIRAVKVAGVLRIRREDFESWLAGVTEPAA